MPQKKEIDNKALIKAVESEMSRREIMAQFGFKAPGQVTTHYLDALVEAGRAKGIVGRQPTAKSGKKAKVLKVNQRGSLVVRRELIEEMGFSIGENFSIRKTKEGMSLKRA